MPTPGIYRRADGLYAAHLQVNGVRRFVYARTEAEARSKLEELRRQADRAGGLSQAETLAEVLARWIEAESPRWRPRTRADYHHLVDDVIGPALGAVRLHRLTPERIQRFYSEVARRSPHEADYCHRVLHRALRVVTLWGLLPANPCDRVVRPGYPRRTRTVWSVDETRRFLARVHDHWLGTFFETAILTGCRFGELAGLRWSDLDGDTLRVERSVQRIGGEWVEGAPKTAAGRRSLHVPPALQAALQRLGPGRPDEPIFRARSGGVLSLSTVNHALYRLADELELPRIGVHGLRHLSASLALQHGVPLPVVSRRLGHSGVQVTAMIYSHALSDDRSAGQVLGRILALDEPPSNG